jgi:hypothetical protein
MENFEIQKMREGIISDEEIGKFRKEMEEMKTEAERKADEYKISRENVPNDELVGLDFDQLTESEWFLYKLYKEGKLNYKILSYRRKDLGMETMEILEKSAKKGQLLDYTKLPREQFLAWLGNRFTADEAERIRKEKQRRKAA